MDGVRWKQRVRQVWEAFLWALPLITFICMALFLQFVQAVFWVILFGLPIAFLVWIISKGAGVKPSRVLQGICGLLMLRMGIAFGTYLWVHSQEKFVVYTPLEIPASFRHEPVGSCGEDGCATSLLASPSVSFYEGEPSATPERGAPRLKFRGSVDRERPECVAILNADSDIDLRSSDLWSKKCLVGVKVENFEAKYIVIDRNFRLNIGLELFFVEDIVIKDGNAIVSEMRIYEMETARIFFGGWSATGQGGIGFQGIMNWWGIMRDDSRNLTCDRIFGSHNRRPPSPTRLGSVNFIASILDEKRDCSIRRKMEAEWDQE